MLHCAELGVVDAGRGPLNCSDLAYHLLENGNDPDNEMSGIVSCVSCAEIELLFVRFENFCNFCSEVPDLRGCFAMHEPVVDADVARRLIDAWTRVVSGEVSVRPDPQFGAVSAQVIPWSALQPSIGARIVVCVAGVDRRVLAVVAQFHRREPTSRLIGYGGAVFSAVVTRSGYQP